jgi:integrase
MRVRLKGINSKRKRLADGSFRTYYWAWKGGPPLRGEPGSPEFHASYNEAVARKVMPPTGKLLGVLQAYQNSDEFLSLAPRSRSDYIGKVKLIEKTFGDFPLSAMTDNRTRGIFKAWREKLALPSRRQADYAWVVLARVLSFGMDRGLVAGNPCARGGRLYRGSRAEKIWTAEDEAAFLQHAPSHLQLALLLALWTGQRQGAICCAFRGRPMTANRYGCGNPKAAVPWLSQSVRGVVGVTFHDLRGTAVTRLAICECTEAQIATITGHSLRSVRAILDTHYLHRDTAMAEIAIRKLERGASPPE